MRLNGYVKLNYVGHANVCQIGSSKCGPKILLLSKWNRRIKQNPLFSTFRVTEYILYIAICSKKERRP